MQEQHNTAIPAPLTADAGQANDEQSTVFCTNLIPQLFHRFVELEKQCKLANEGKAAIFADAKEKRLDARALRVAFRLEMQEHDQPGSLQKHEAMNSLTTRYLAALRGDEQARGTSSPNNTDKPSPEPLDVAEPISDPRARSRAREAVAVGADGMQASVSKPDQLKHKTIVPGLKLALEEEPDIPECLRAKVRVQKTPPIVGHAVSVSETSSTPELT